MRWLVLAAALGLSGCAEYAKAYNAIAIGPPAQRQVAQPGQPVYSASECVGAIVNGVCHGSIIPQTAVHPRCYGEMLNGVCTGPMF